MVAGRSYKYHAPPGQSQISSSGAKRLVSRDAGAHFLSEIILSELTPIWEPNSLF